MGLNPEQQRAVETIDGPLMILAGAGSGKTTVLMNRIAYMVKQGIDPRRILAVTFTNKAANEMRERISHHVEGHEAARLHLSTFHSFCLEVLQRERNFLETPRFNVADEGNSRSYMRQLLKGNTKFKPQTIVGYISAFKN
jgi:DNA helicase-2/ATP-dependent DNA helicase PcrA